jgi:ferrous iron transport protein B
MTKARTLLLRWFFATTTDAAQKTSLKDGLLQAFATIPVNIDDALQNLSDPLGLGVLDDTHSQTSAARSQEVSTETFGAMVSRLLPLLMTKARTLLLRWFFATTTGAAQKTFWVNTAAVLVSGAKVTILKFALKAA